jgi:hypothetical protein
LVDEAMMKSFAEAGEIFFEAADKAIFEAIRGRYPHISLEEMLVCLEAYWNYRDHNFPEYEQIVACLKEVRLDEIPEELRKEFHRVNEGSKSSSSLIFFRSEQDVKRAIYQAHRHGYIKYKIKEYTTGGADLEKSDPSTLVWYPVIFLVLEDEALYKELNEATGQFFISSIKQFFPSSSTAEEEGEEIDKRDNKKEPSG